MLKLIGFLIWGKDVSKVLSGDTSGSHLLVTLGVALEFGERKALLIYLNLYFSFIVRK